jgi:hypothetical protein
MPSARGQPQGGSSSSRQGCVSAADFRVAHWSAGDDVVNGCVLCMIRVKLCTFCKPHEALQVRCSTSHARAAFIHWGTFAGQAC